VLIMLRAALLAMSILGLSGGYASGDAPADPGANAALKYWQAFATLSTFTDAEGNKLNAECLTMPLDGEAREIVSKADYALQMLHQGAAAPSCDWGISYEAGYNTRLPHGPAARLLCSLACLRARLSFEDGHNGEAINDVIAAMTLSRHVSQDGPLIVVLIGHNIEPRMSEVLARYLPKLDAMTIKNLQTRLAALPAGGRPSKAMKLEERDMEWFIRKVKEAKDEQSLVELLGLVSASEGKGRERQEQSRVFLKECGGTADDVVKAFEKLRPCYELMGTMLDLPLDQFEKEWKIEETRQAGNPVFKRLFPPMPKLRLAQARIDVRRALLSAALAMQLEGRDALKTHLDPVGGGPFEFVLFDGGFELRSKQTQTDGKPIVLTVGKKRG
jgi:hypothetical protein